MADTHKAYLEYLDKEMSIMGVLCAFSVGVLALALDRILGNDKQTWLPRLRLPPGGFLISRGCQLSRHRRHVWYCEADVIEGGAACRAGRLLRVQEDEGVGKLN